MIQYQRGMNNDPSFTFANILAFGGSLLLAFAIGGHVGKALARGQEADVTQVQVVVDTLYRPPPGFIEAFRLRCTWEPRTESIDVR